jgi:hypothetical protein
MFKINFKPSHFLFKFSGSKTCKTITLITVAFRSAAAQRQQNKRLRKTTDTSATSAQKQETGVLCAVRAETEYIGCGVGQCNRRDLDGELVYKKGEGGDAAAVQSL